MPWLSRSEAATALGWSTDQVRRAGDKGDLDRTLVGNRYRYHVPSGNETVIDDVFASVSDMPDAVDYSEAPTSPMRPSMLHSKAPVSSTEDCEAAISIERAPPGQVKRVMVINDVHVPDQCPLLWQTALRWILDNKPDEILILGDFGEYESMSQHGSAADTPTLRQDLEDNRQALEVLRRHAPNARFTYAEGNHETRPKRAGSAVLPRVASILDVPHMLGLNDLGIGWVKEGRMIRRGKLRFVHGYWASDNAAKTHLTKYGFSIACGHVHRPQVFTMPDGENNIRAAYVLPCMRTLDAAWLNGKPSGWTNGFSVHEYDDEGDFTLQMILAKDGKFIWNGRSYRP